MALTAYGRPLTKVSSFKYLRWFMSAPDNAWPEVIWNLQRERHKWAYLSQLIKRDWEDTWMSGFFYTMVVQVVLLYKSESWVMSPQIGKVLGSIHHQEIQRLTGKIPNMNGYETWKYLPLGPEMAEANMQMI